MSARMLDYIIDANYIDAFSSSELARVKALILAGHDDAAVGQQQQQQAGPQWLHEIVANGRNGIDVDKVRSGGDRCHLLQSSPPHLCQALRAARFCLTTSRPALPRLPDVLPPPARPLSLTIWRATACTAASRSAATSTASSSSARSSATRCASSTQVRGAGVRGCGGAGMGVGRQYVCG